MPLSDAIDHARRIGRLPLTLTLLESADIQKKADSQQPAADTEESALHTAGISEKEPLIQKNLCDARREINRTANDKVYYIIRINKHALRYAAMLIIVVAAVLSIAIPYSHQTPEIDKASVLPIDTMIDSSRNKEIINDSADTGKTVPASAAKPETDSLAEREKEYHLIVATFRTPEEAEYFIKAAKDTAYDLKIVKSKKLCRVSAKSDDSKEKLLAVLNSADFKRRYKGSWIWRRTD